MLHLLSYITWDPAIDAFHLGPLSFRWYPQLAEFQKEKRHEALNDIRESIAELAYYRKTIFK